MTTIELKPEQHLSELARQIHSRGHAYVISDRLTHQHIVLAQNLTKAHQFLAQIYEDDPPCIASLYEASTARIRSGLHHRRWRVLRVPLEEAAQEFERERRCGYAHPVVLAQRRDQMRLITA